MKRKTLSLICAAALLLTLALAGCSQVNTPQLANQLTFSLDGISEVTISYDEEEVTFFEGEGNDLVVKEYMTSDKKSYHAKVNEQSGSIKVSEGGKPIFKDNFSRYIEVYLPGSYQNELTVTTTNGNIDFSKVDLNLSALRVDSTSGAVQVGNATAKELHLSSTSGTLNLGNLEAETIRLETTSGNVSCEKLNGTVTYTSTSGNAEFLNAVGSGSYRADNSGKLQVTYTNVTGDLSLFNKNDSVDLILPSDLEFDFQATTKNGSISTSFQESIAINGDTTSGTVGAHPTVTVKVETKNGNIEVSQ